MPRNPELPWQTKVKILEFAASLGRDNLVGIQRSLDTWLNTLPVEERPMGMAPDTRTIRRVIEEELDKLPPEVVIEQLPRSVWHLCKDHDHIKEIANSLTPGYEGKHGTLNIIGVADDKAMLFDKHVFARSEKIINEKDLRDILLGLEAHRSYRSSKFLKVCRFFEFIELEGNKYTDPIARKLQEDLCKALEPFVVFLNEEFKAEGKRKKEKDLECRLDPTGLRYIHDNKAKAERISEAASQLDELVKNVREVYTVYRAGIRDRLYL